MSSFFGWASPSVCLPAKFSIIDEKLTDSGRVVASRRASQCTSRDVLSQDVAGSGDVIHMLSVRGAAKRLNAGIYYMAIDASDTPIPTYTTSPWRIIDGTYAQLVDGWTQDFTYTVINGVLIAQAGAALMSANGMPAKDIVATLEACAGDAAHINWNGDN